MAPSRRRYNVYWEICTRKITTERYHAVQAVFDLPGACCTRLHDHHSPRIERQTSPLQLIRRRGRAQRSDGSAYSYLRVKTPVCFETRARESNLLTKFLGLGKRGEEPPDKVWPTARYHHAVLGISEEPMLCHTSTLLQPIRARLPRPIP